MRADRLLSILMLLQSNGRMTAADLAQELEVSERTIYRDVTALGTSGVPVYTESGPGGGISLMDHYRSDLTGLTRDEIQVLFLLGVPSSLMELGLDQQLKGALRKLSAALTFALKGQEKSLKQRIHIDGEGWEQTGEMTPHLLNLQQAAWENRMLQIEYRSLLGARAGPLEAEVNPYGLVTKAGAWYLVASRDEHMIVLRVERILAVHPCEQNFERPEGFDLALFWQAWCVENQDTRARFEVTVRISVELRPYMTSVYGNALMVEETGADQKDGWTYWQLTFENFDEARGRILALGRAIEVVDPISLRLSVFDFAQQISEMYKHKIIDRP